MTVRGVGKCYQCRPPASDVAIVHRELSGEDHCCYTLSALAQRSPMEKKKKSRDKKSRKRKKVVAFPVTDKHSDKSHCPAVTHLDGAEGSKVKPLKTAISSPNQVPAKQDGLQEVRPAPECLQDGPRPQKQELEEINIASEGEPRRPIFICKDLPAEQRGPLIELIRKYSDVFAWTYEEMPGLDKDVTMHRLNVISLARPVKQGVRFYKPEVELNIKDEVVKLLGAGFIKPIQHPTWLSSIVPVIKKNGQIRVCVDFRDLNKSCPKDEFPLPNIDTLIDSAAGHHMFSFMDGFSGYNQIKMAPKDAPKTAFRTPIGNFFYTVMPFGLKNAGATYQRAMTTIFHDMLHKSLECYIDDLVVKSKEETSHLKDLQRVFERCKKYKLRMDPLKCAFGVTAGKFLGCIVHRHGIDPDPAKVATIKNMPRPTSLDELRTFLGRASYLRRFIPAMAEITQPFNSLLKKDVRFIWNEEHQQAFEGVKSTLTSPLSMTPPQPARPLLLYITSTPKSVGALLAQEIDGLERPVYYISRVIQGAEVRYSPIERHCLALVFAAKKLRHYLLSYPIHLMTRSDPIRFLLTRPALSGRPARWLLSLAEYDITCKAPKAIKSQALADLLAHFPSGEHESPSDELPGDEFQAAEVNIEGEWSLSFDGSFTSKGGGAGIVLISSNQTEVNLSYKLDFKCSNNEAEYEALILGLMAALDLGVSLLCIKGDSNLVVKQTNGDYAIKEPPLGSYRTIVQRLTDKFNMVRIEHAPRSNNRHPDALATLASKVEFAEESTKIEVLKRSMPCSVTTIFPEKEPADWRAPIIEVLISSNQTEVNLSYKLDFKCSNNEAEYKALILVLMAALDLGVSLLCIKGDSNLVVKQTNGDYAIKEPPLASYRTIVQRLTDKFDMVRIEHAPRSNNRHPDALATLASKVEFAEESTKIEVLKRSMPCSVTTIFPEKEPADWRAPIIDELRAPSGDVSLYRKLQRQGYYWPTMAKEANDLQGKCTKCQEFAPKAECNFAEITSDWRQVYIDYLKEASLPPDRSAAAIIKKRASKFFLQEGQLFRHGFDGKPLRCLSGAEIHKVLELAHGSEHQGGAKLFQHLLHIGYYWPTMEADAKIYAKCCKPCQLHGNLIHAPATDLHSSSSPWPFHTWAMDLIGPISPPSKGHIWIVAATETYTKWVGIL
ncbi:uncharacterized protein LOC114286987 [Camellia sinensis]|uniref:uncharacterized protein LOC114286987 n=1 Tax=Camellia sinensis TaxID=4442 RepID=UPI001035EB3D|nr:uncharacterized protein LOC114286987 [Camellia sinensis]